MEMQIEIAREGIRSDQCGYVPMKNGCLAEGLALEALPLDDGLRDRLVLRALVNGSTPADEFMEANGSV